MAANTAAGMAIQTWEDESVEKKKRLLIYAHYYIPDTASTGQILRELAEGLQDTFEVTVICVVPSYLGAIENRYQTRKYYRESINGVQVLRVRVPEFHKTSKISRVRNIFSYFFGAMAATCKTGKQDYVLSVSQPPILGGLLGVWGKWVKRAGFIYNIQDYNPEQTIAVGYCKNRLILKAMMLSDKFSCKKSNLIITVGCDLGETLEKRFAKDRRVPRYTVIHNWTDEKEIYPLDHANEGVRAFQKKYGLEHKFTFVYSGNIGLYYDLEGIIRVIEKFQGVRTPDKREVAFAFIGAGSVLDGLMTYVRQHSMENVLFIPYQPMEDLIYSLNAGDVYWCVNAKGIRGVSVPSKIYGIMAAGKPILGVQEEGTEAWRLIHDAQCGRCAAAGDYPAIRAEVEWFIENSTGTELAGMGRRGREYLMQNLTKEVSVAKYKRAISDCQDERDRRKDRRKMKMAGKKRSGQ